MRLGREDGLLQCVWRLTTVYSAMLLTDGHALARAAFDLGARRRCTRLTIACALEIDSIGRRRVLYLIVESACASYQLIG